jgi:hypothetical protein
MPWPWPPLHQVYRAFDDLSERDARAVVKRMLRGYRAGMAADACVFGACILGLLSPITCLGSSWLLRTLPVNIEGFAIMVTTIAVGIPAYLGATWRYQRLAARALDARMGAFGDSSWNVCLSCRYPLGGLPAYGDHVVCPECGASQLIGVTAEQARGRSIKENLG